MIYSNCHCKCTMEHNSSTASDQFNKNGFLLAKNILPDEILGPIKELINKNVDLHAQELMKKGELTELYQEAPFETRLALLYKNTESRMRSWNHFLFSRELFNLIRYPGILDFLEPILGPEISFNGDYHLRPKLPSNTYTSFPLHQDSQYYGSKTEPITIVTIWIPLIDVNEKNGCLWVIPGSHKWGLLPSARGEDQNMRSFENVEERGDPVPIPMNYGDILAFHNLTFHASKVNNSNSVRWSTDIRYRSTPGHIKLSKKEQEGHEFLSQQLSKTLKPPLVVKSKEAEAIQTFESWEISRENLILNQKK